MLPVNLLFTGRHLCEPWDLGRDLCGEELLRMLLRSS
jgi:hypothetical protein